MSTLPTFHFVDEDSKHCPMERHLGMRRVAILGRTGDGKSALAALFALILGAVLSPFEESSRANSHTHRPVSCSVDGIHIIDTPGLLDTQGTKEDAQNIRNIVQFFKSLGELNGFLIVLNEQAVRFDSGMQDAIKLIVDSFGSGVLYHMGIVFTRSYGGVTLQEAQTHAGEIRELISARTGHSVPELPCWQVDCHPENLAAMGVAQDRINAAKQRTAVAAHDILQWVRVQPPFQTEQAVAADYDHVRLLEEEKKAREQDNLVVSTIEEKRTRQTGTTPITETRTHRERTAPIRVGNMGTSKVTTLVFVGNTKHMVKEQRKVETLGNGRVVYGEWHVVDKWDVRVLF